MFRMDPTFRAQRDRVTRRKRESLQRDVGRGGAVAIVPSPDGILAVSLRGAPNEVLVEGAALWLLVDDRARVMGALDLRAREAGVGAESRREAGRGPGGSAVGEGGTPSVDRG